MRLVVQVSIALLVLALPALAELVVPVLTGPVVDQAAVLSPMAIAELSEKLRALNADGKGPVQMQILLIPTLAGESIEGYSIRVTDAWKLGTKGRDQGLLLVVAVNDHQIRFEVGRGLEGDFPDITAGKLIREMKPYLQKNDYGQALNFAVTAIQKRFDPNNPHPKGVQDDEDTPYGLGYFVVLVLVLIFAFRTMRRFRGGGSGGIFWGGGGFGGGSSGGGSSWSGGGGSFSGGGASGRW